MIAGVFSRRVVSRPKSGGIRRYFFVKKRKRKKTKNNIRTKDRKKRKGRVQRPRRKRKDRFNNLLAVLGAALFLYALQSDSDAVLSLASNILVTIAGGIKN